ncbi:MAG: acyltransferase [Chitinophagaceae bacterium]|nr:acyltransferase [Chitinophagaceae bacterium]
MKKNLQLLKAILRANPKTIYFNFKYLPWRQAIRFPFWVSSKTYLRKTSGVITINSPIRTGMIRIGYGDISIFDKKRSRSIWDVRGKVIFGGDADIGHGSKITVGETGELWLGNNFSITAESTILAFKKILFGNDCLLSWDILIMDSDFHHIKNEKAEIENPPAEIIIGNQVWIGCRSLILKGSIIPNGCVIAANSLINKALSGENQVFGSKFLTVTAIKQNIQWSK